MKIKIVKHSENKYKSVGCIHNFLYKDGKRWTKEEYKEYKRIVEEKKRDETN